MSEDPKSGPTAQLFVTPAMMADVEQLRLDVRADIQALYWCIWMLWAAVIVLAAGLVRVVFW